MWSELQTEILRQLAEGKSVSFGPGRDRSIVIRADAYHPQTQALCQVEFAVDQRQLALHRRGDSLLASTLRQLGDALSKVLRQPLPETPGGRVPLDALLEGQQP